MGTGSLRIRHMGQERYDRYCAMEILDASGHVAGNIRVYSDWQADGSVCTQLELRFEDQPSLVTASEFGLADERHEAGRAWVLVEMAPRRSFTEPVRLSINIPGKTRANRQPAWDAEIAATEVRASRAAISAVRAGCGSPYGCHYPVCDLAEDGPMRKLANDGCIAVLVPLETQPLHPQDPGS